MHPCLSAIVESTSPFLTVYVVVPAAGAADVCWFCEAADAVDAEDADDDGLPPR